MPLVKPSSPTINWGHPLTKARGLRYDALFQDRNKRPVNLVTRAVGAPTGSAATIGISPIGSTLSFNGTGSNYVDFTEATWNIVTGTKLTLECWVILNDTVGGQMFSKPHASGAHTSPFFSYAIQTTSLGGRIWIATSNNSGGVSTTEVAMTTGKLHHVVGTYDGTNIRFYLNGVLKATTGATGTITNFTGVPLRITSNGGGSEVINGKICSQRMWDQCLNQAEIRSLFASPWQLYTKKSLINTSAPAASTLFALQAMLMGMGT